MELYNFVDAEADVEDSESNLAGIQAAIKKWQSISAAIEEITEVRNGFLTATTDALETAYHAAEAMRNKLNDLLDGEDEDVEQDDQMEELTKRKALEITQEMWKWLAKGKNRSKDDWPSLSYYEDRYGEFLSTCPLCAYAERELDKAEAKPNGICKFCPLMGKWVKGDRFSRCTDSDSPYRLWITGAGSTHCAQQVADLCKEELGKEDMNG